MHAQRPGVRVSVVRGGDAPGRGEAEVGGHPDVVEGQPAGGRVRVERAGVEHRGAGRRDRAGAQLPDDGAAPAVQDRTDDGESGRVVEINPSGWRVLQESPVLFGRTARTGSLPVPVRGAQLSELCRD